MIISTGQHLRLDQRMKLAPRMIQSMEILQMSSQALEARIEQELTSNPTLEQRELGPDTEQLERDRLQEQRDNREGERDLVVQDDSVDPSHADDFERLNNLSEEYGEAWTSNIGDSTRFTRYDGERDAKLDAMANTAARQLSLSDQLLMQWHLVESSATIRTAGEYLIGYIGNDGYLRTDIEALKENAPAELTTEDLEEALKLIQESLDPIGIGARNLRECLLMQIDARMALANGPDLSIEHMLVDRYLEDIGHNRLPRVAKSTGLSIDQVKLAIQNLRQFDPRPGRLLVDDMPRAIRPDATVEYDEVQDKYVACLTRGRSPSLQISSVYASMQGDKSVDTKTRKFVNSNLRSARWLLEAVEQRSSTLLRVINVVIDAQRDFFDHGPQALHPLPMTTVADQLGIHVATVSRAVNEKYLQTPRGIVPLRMFFSGGTETESGDSVSWSAIQAKLEQIINEEDKSSPLNDDQLVEKLTEHGIDIARRTVAKYRKQLNIASARQRREY